MCAERVYSRLFGFSYYFAVLIAVGIIGIIGMLLICMCFLPAYYCIKFVVCFSYVGELVLVPLKNIPFCLSPSASMKRRDITEAHATAQLEEIIDNTQP